MKSRTFMSNKCTATDIDDFINATPGFVVSVTTALAASAAGATIVVTVLYDEEDQ